MSIQVKPSIGIAIATAFREHRIEFYKKLSNSLPEDADVHFYCQNFDDPRIYFPNPAWKVTSVKDEVGLDLIRGRAESIYPVLHNDFVLVIDDDFEFDGLDSIYRVIPRLSADTGCCVLCKHPGRRYILEIPITKIPSYWMMSGLLFRSNDLKASLEMALKADSCREYDDMLLTTCVALNGKYLFISYDPKHPTHYHNQNSVVATDKEHSIKASQEFYDVLFNYNPEDYDLQYDIDQHPESNKSIQYFTD